MLFLGPMDSFLQASSHTPLPTSPTEPGTLVDICSVLMLGGSQTTARHNCNAVGGVTELHTFLTQGRLAGAKRKLLCIHYSSLCVADAGGTGVPLLLGIIEIRKKKGACVSHICE